ncbi:hypothetical protein K469DRAFT_762641 [Zopfia rhizophila CBS 207.26]|uniref:Uncharacterized protein n=1 Tax=Zopfia rhizophila CBS 207.26 TaxID=1314779 RepID=A0A6A6EGC4_9PEZI|nr:hypothetical protein K469DRAFT_762641 [Zopfia rhizophila CBS 207.26]
MGEQEVDGGAQIRLRRLLPLLLPALPAALPAELYYRELRISRCRTRSLRNQITLFSYTSSPSSNPFSAQNSCHSLCLGSYVLFVFLGRITKFSLVATP